MVATGFIMIEISLPTMGQGRCRCSNDRESRVHRPDLRERGAGSSSDSTPFIADRSLALSPAAYNLRNMTHEPQFFISGTSFTKKQNP